MMNTADLDKKWKWLIRCSAVLVVLALVGLVVFGLFLANFRKANEAARAALVKADDQLVGERMTIPRDGLPSVSTNIYRPSGSESGRSPVVLNIHGGGFVGGDADVLDTQSQRLADEWGAVVIAVDYTKADVQPIGYGSREIADAAIYAIEHSDELKVDPERLSLMGYSAGAYYALDAALLLQQEGIEPLSVVLAYPWLTGFASRRLDSKVPPILFVLAGSDPISENSKKQFSILEKAGAPVTRVEYPKAVHSFIESNNPEGTTGMQQDMSGVINPEQERLAREAEQFAGEWIAEQSGAGR